MAIGKNPHVSKAEAAEQKASCAKDNIAREQAWREAARLWERAAERETDGKRRQQYTENSEQARTYADAPPQGAAQTGAHLEPFASATQTETRTATAPALQDAAVAPTKPKTTLLN